MMKFFKYYQQTFGILNHVLFLLMLMSLAFPWAFTQPLFALWLITWALEGRWLNRKNWHFSKASIPVLLMCGFVAWESLSLLWTQDLSSGWNEVNRHLPIFGILLMIFFGNNDYYRSYKMKTALMVGSLLAVLCYSIVIYWNAQAGTLYTLWPYFNYWTLFGEGPVQLLKHRLYLCIVLLLAVFYSGDVYRHLATRYSKYSCLATVCVADAILLTAVCLSGSRTTIMMLPVLGGIYLLAELPKKFRWYIIGGFAALVITGTVILTRYNWRFIIMQQDLVTLRQQQTVDGTLYEPRLYIWSTVLNHAPEYGLTGLGAGSSDRFLCQCYEQDHTAYDLDLGSHNNYLYIWMDYGYIGLIYLLVLLISIPFFHTGQARVDAAVACFIFGCCLFTENLLTMMSSLYIVFALMILIQSKEREQDSLPPVHP